MVLSTFLLSILLVLTTVLQSRHHYYSPHFTFPHGHRVKWQSQDLHSVWLGSSCLRVLILYREVRSAFSKKLAFERELIDDKKQVLQDFGEEHFKEANHYWIQMST